MPEITGDLQLYTEFYKVGEAYGHWKFTIDDLEAYLDIPKVLWSDKLVAFGHTATGGLFYDSRLEWDYTNLRLNVNKSSATPIAQDGAIVTYIDSGVSLHMVNGSASSGGRSTVVFSRSRGSVAAPTATANNDRLGSIVFNGHDGTNYLGGAGIEAYQDDTVSTGYAPARISFTSGTGGTRFERLTIKHDGKVGIATTAPSRTFDVNGDARIRTVANNNALTNLLVIDGSGNVEYRTVASLPGGGGSGTVTSVDAAFLNGTALTVVGGAITTAGTFDFEWQGLNTDYVAGDGSIIAFPTLTSGTVTSISAGNGMSFTTITTSGAVTLGTPSSITLASTNSVGVGTHSHLFAPGGTTAQYIRGDGTLATTPLGSVTSVGMTITAATALSVAGSPITTSGTFAVTWTGNNTQYVAGDGSLITFPTVPTVTPAALTKTDDTNVTLTLGGTPSTALLQATSITVGWSGTLAVSRGGSGAGTFTAGYLKANGTSPFTTVATIPYSDITGTPTIPTQYWQKNSTTLAPLTITDRVSIGQTVGDVFGLTLYDSTAAINDMLRLRSNSASAGNGSRISFYFQGSALLGYVQNHSVASPAGFYTDVYGREYVRLMTSSDGGTTINTVLQGDATGLILIPNLGGVGTRMVVANAAGALSTQAIPTGTGTVTSFSAGNLSPLFTSSVATATTTPALTFALTNAGANTWFGNATGGATSPAYNSAAALTRTNDTNVTLTLGGSPTTALLAATSMTLGWTGTLSEARGGSKWTLTSTTLAPTTSTRFVAIGQTTADNNGLTINSQTSGTINDILRLRYNTATAGNGARISFYFQNSALTGYISNENTGSGFTNTQYGRETVILRTSPDGGVTPTDVLTCQQNGYVKLHSIATSSTSVNLLTTNAGVIETRTIASLTGLTTDVWKIQGGTTNASAITDDIYHNGKLRVGNSTSSAYMLSVSGTGYFTSTVDFNNNVGIQGFTTGAVIKNLLKLNASNYAELGTSGNDLLLAAYTSGRSADTKATTDMFAYVNTSGLAKLDKSQWVRNDGASVYITSTESHAADSTPRRVTFDAGLWTNNTFYGQVTTAGDFKINFPSADSEHLVICTLEYTTSGTPTVTLTLRETSTTVETNITTSADGRKVLTIQTIMSAGTSDYPTLYISVATAAITLQKCRLSIIPLGETPP